MRAAPSQLSAFALALVLNGAALGLLASLASSRPPPARTEPEPLVVQLLRPEPAPAPARPEPPPPDTRPARPARVEPPPPRPQGPSQPPRPAAIAPAPPAPPAAAAPAPAVAAPAAQAAVAPSAAPRPADEPRPAPTAGAPSASVPTPAAAAIPPAAPAMPPPAPVAAAPRIGPRVDANWSGNQPPPYPAMARRLGEEGEVRLDVLVGADGTVQDVRLRRSSGSSVLDRTAIETVKKWRFKPATQDGRPIAEWYEGWRWVFRLEP